MAIKGFFIAEEAFIPGLSKISLAGLLGVLLGKSILRKFLTK
jgi:hypothetical protein